MTGLNFTGSLVPLSLGMRVVLPTHRLEGRQLDISQRLSSTSSSGLGIDSACCSVLSSGPGAVLLSLFLIAQSISLITIGCRVSHAGSRTGSGVLLLGLGGVCRVGASKSLPVAPS